MKKTENKRRGEKSRKEGKKKRDFTRLFY